MFFDWIENDIVCLYLFHVCMIECLLLLCYIVVG